MKRIGFLYNDIYKIENIISAYKDVCSHIRNKNKAINLKEYKCIYISRIYNVLKNKEYTVGSYNIFKIYEPKERIIVSQNVQDKIINHLVSKHILYPSLNTCLLDSNVASRKGLGTKRGIELAMKYHRMCKIKYEKYYILKCDISKFFASINHNILKQKLKKRIKDKDALQIVFNIIDSNSNGLSIRKYVQPSISNFLLK